MCRFKKGEVMSKEKMSGGEAMVQAAIANGIDTIFGIPGAQTYPLFDGIYKSGLDLVVPRHEQAAAYMAMGYAKSTGKTGVFSVVPGPGVLNASAALCTAMGNCSPMVGLIGQVPTPFLGKGRGHLHELRDQIETLQGIIKDAVRIDNPEETSSIVNQAFHTAMSGRPGPVTVEMCWDTMAKQYDVEITEDNQQRGLPELDLDAINDAVKLIANAKKPMIMCGAGALHASDEVLALAQLLNAPVTAFRSGRGVVAEDHPLGISPVAARELWDDTDVLIGIGSRLEMPYLRWSEGFSYELKPSYGPKLIRIDIDPEALDCFQPDIGIAADSATVCRLLVDKLTPLVSPDANRLQEISKVKKLAWEAIQKIQPQIAYLQVIREILPQDGFFVPDLSQVGFASWIGGFPVYKPRTYVSEGFQGTLGFAFPTSLGVKVANPDKAVVCVCGDGGFMFGMQELATAAQYKIGVVTLVFNNSAFGNVRRDQEMRFGGRIIGSEFENPDFVKLAESFNISGHRVNNPEELRPVLLRAIEDGTPALIEIVCERGSETSPWEFINMYKPLSQK